MNALLFRNIFNVYQAFNFRKIKNLFVVSARFCEIYFILQVLLYTFKGENQWWVGGRFSNKIIWRFNLEAAMQADA